MVPQGRKQTKRLVEHDVLSLFLNEYKFILAKTPSEKNRALQLRHDVFMKEFNYKMKEDKTNEIETDEYDEYSLHCLIEHKRSGLLAGCMRLIMPVTDPKSKFNKLPVEIQGAKSLNHQIIHPSIMSKLEICEVSRLAISKETKKRKKIRLGCNQIHTRRRKNFPCDRNCTFSMHLFFSNLKWQASCFCNDGT